MRWLTLGSILWFSFSISACGGTAAAAPSSASAKTGSERLWQDAGIFQPVQDQVQGARVRVWVEMYEFDRDDIAAWLVAARERDLDVRVIYDPSVAVSQARAARLRLAGIPTRPYPLDDRAHQIDHVKLLLTESRALVGGMNWGRTSAANHDYAIETGSLSWLASLAAIFEQDWTLAGGHPGRAAYDTPLLAEGVVETTPGAGIRGLLQADLAATRSQARVEVFVLTDPDVIAALAACRRRGARVRVLLDPNQDVNRPAYQLLRLAGVEVRWYPVAAGAKLHAKAGLFDGSLLVGSANWSRSGLSSNHELDVQTREAPLTNAFAARFEVDWTASPR